jgi:hypothetical protein
MTEDQLRHRTLALQRDTLGETQQHNRATEEISRQGLEEQKRHSIATENIDLGKLAETTRHDKATEGIDLGKLNENIQHNRATESIDLGRLANEQFKAAEIARHDQATEAQTTVGQNIELGKLAETRRHDQATEQLTGIYNQLWKEVQDRSNDLKRQGNYVEKAKLDNDLKKWKAQLKETVRHNKVDEIEKAVDVGSKALKNVADAANKITDLGGLRRNLETMFKTALPY